jgi:hypothetical protein
MKDNYQRSAVAGCGRQERTKGANMANSSASSRGFAGIGLGGVLVIAGIVIAFVWSVWLGVVLAIVGLVAFGGFARGKWY